MKTKYQPQLIEKKWQSKWIDEAIFSPDIDRASKPYYSLMMFPYPSAEGLHVGNMYAFTGADIHARFMRMQGYDVFEPMGLDGFGIHSENYAIKIGKHIFDLSKQSEKRFYEQLKSIGNSFDWNRTVETYKPEYYKWTQWIFLKMYEQGLAYKAKSDVNWCPSCKTVLADEQVLPADRQGIAGKCERCSSVVEKRKLEQWFFRITKYADRLLKNLEKLDWSERVKIAQRNWIGRSEGMLIEFKIQNSKFKIQVFTTRPETIDGATFIVISPDHELASGKKSEEWTGLNAMNPVTREEIPIWVADYVLSDYGTGAIMAVPDADERDREFAKKHKLPIVKTTFKAKPKGEKKITYHLRDWLISRQRYWGPPIPIIYCDKCGVVPVPEKDLPVELPYVEDFQPKGTGVSPLATAPEFYKVKCPNCDGEARRETDVSDTFLDSAWYFLAYIGKENSKFKIQNSKFKQRAKKWLPVNMYIGGAEHSVLHLLYARFLTMAFKDMGLISHFEEPFTKFRAHGLLISEGAKMSKSKGNVVNPDEHIREYGADTLRMYLMFLGPFDQGGDFRDEAIIGIKNFLDRIWRLSSSVIPTPSVVEGEGSNNNTSLDSSTLSHNDMRMMNKTVKKVTEDIKNLKYNTAIAALMEWLNFLTKKSRIQSSEFRTLLLLLAPFAPHITEELWQAKSHLSSGTGSIHLEKWPDYDEKYLQEKEVKIPVQVDGKLRGVVTTSPDHTEAVILALALKDDKIMKYLKGKKYKTVYITGKILNFILEN